MIAHSSKIGGKKVLAEGKGGGVAYPVMTDESNSGFT